MDMSIGFCGYCGAALNAAAERPHYALPLCESCVRAGRRSPYHRGPALLVLTHIFANERILLMQRGIEPYKGTWAPPGGFVESGESLESAAIRETWEETRIQLDRRKLVPHAIHSLPHLNQVCHVFNVFLREPVEARAVAPESLDVGWFTREDLRSLPMWEPAAILDFDLLFENAREGRFHFHQYSDEFSRVVSESMVLRYLRRIGKSGDDDSGA